MRKRKGAQVFELAPVAKMASFASGCDYEMLFTKQSPCPYARAADLITDGRMYNAPARFATKINGKLTL